MSADLTTIMEALVRDINAQSFTLPIQGITNPVSVQGAIRKLPTKQSTTDPTAMVVVCPGRADVFQKKTMGGHYFVEVGVMCVVVASNQTSATANLDALMTIRQTIAGIIDGYGRAVLPNMLKSAVVYDAPLDPDKMDKAAWDYSAIEGRFTLFY